LERSRAMTKHLVNFALSTLLILAGILFGQDNKVNTKSAQVKGDSKAPLPEKLKTAKTILLVNDTGDLPVFDRFYSEIKKWDRFAIVDSREKADLVALLTSDVSRTVTVYSATGVVNGPTVTASGTGAGVPIKAFYLKIYNSQTAEQLWSDSVEGWWTNKGAVTKLATNLRKRMR
jgi:hypothetical protein